MNRPTVTPEIVAAAASVFCVRNGWDEDQAGDIAAEYQSYLDGYGLAKALDRNRGWDISAADVDALDDFANEVCEAHRHACIQWARDNNIQPPLPIGTMTTRGEIAGVSEHSPATYRIREHGETNPTRFLLVKFEDAVQAVAA